MRKRSIRFRTKRRKLSDGELDITSLLDVLVILLIFLIQSYNASGVVFKVQEGIVLPKSNSQSINQPGVIVQVSEDKILVDDKLVVDLQKNNRVFDGPSDKRIMPLFEELVQKRETAQITQKSVPGAKPFSGAINFVMHQELGYQYVRKILFTASEAGFFKFNMVVLTKTKDN